MSYADLGDADQVEALRPVAVQAAARFGLDVVSLEVVRHAYNTTFAVDTTDGRRVALRVNTNSTSTPAEVVAQQAWQLAIAAQTPVLVPAPLLTRESTWFAVVPNETLGRDLLVTAATWLDGPDVGQPDPHVTHRLGRTMALLHGHAQTWPVPGDGAMPRFDRPLFGDEDRLDSAPGLSPEQREVLDRARELAEVAFARVYATAPVRPLHADLHGGNLKWHEGRLAVFDFDDCGLGVPALDLAISTFYLRGGDAWTGEGDASLEAALRAGYTEVAPLPQIDPDDYEALVASRQLLLANDLLGTTTAEQRAMARTYLPTSLDRLRHWLDTGTFTRDLPPTSPTTG